MQLDERSGLLVWWALLTVTLSLLAPASSVLLTVPVRFLFWSLHVAGALGALVLATAMVLRVPRLRSAPAWLRVVVGALLGSMLFAPFALWIEGLFPESGLPDDDEGWMWALEQSGLLGELIVEWFELLPEFTMVWVLVNLSLPALGAAPFGRQIAQGSSLVTAAGAEDAEPAEAAVTGNEPATVAPTIDAPIVAQLPEKLGSDLICLRAELNYVHVRTTAGEAMVLSSLAKALDGLDAHGLQIHRSWWVADAHVRRLRRTSKGYRCELSDGTAAPVSRRKQREAIERFGRDAVYNPP